MTSAVEKVINKFCGLTSRKKKEYSDYERKLEDAYRQDQQENTEERCVIRLSPGAGGLQKKPAGDYWVILLNGILRLKHCI